MASRAIDRQPTLLAVDWALMRSEPVLTEGDDSIDTKMPNLPLQLTIRSVTALASTGRAAVVYSSEPSY